MPSSPGYKRNYKQELATEKKNHPERVKERAARNKARATLMAEGKVKKGDGKHVDHKVPLSKGGGNSRSNLRVRDGNANASYQRTKTGAMKHKNQK